LAAGCFPPNWAKPKAFPISPLTWSGNVRKSRFEDPTQWSGFSPFYNTRITGLSRTWDKAASASADGQLMGSADRPQDVGSDRQ
jgi:hypothetical protein